MKKRNQKFSKFMKISLTIFALFISKTTLQSSPILFKKRSSLKQISGTNQIQHYRMSSSTPTGSMTISCHRVYFSPKPTSNQLNIYRANQITGDYEFLQNDALSARKVAYCNFISEKQILVYEYDGNLSYFVNVYNVDSQGRNTLSSDFVEKSAGNNIVAPLITLKTESNLAVAYISFTKTFLFYTVSDSVKKVDQVEFSILGADDIKGMVFSPQESGTRLWVTAKYFMGSMDYSNSQGTINKNYDIQNQVKATAFLNSPTFSSLSPERLMLNTENQNPITVYLKVSDGDFKVIAHLNQFERKMTSGESLINIQKTEYFLGLFSDDYQAVLNNPRLHLIQTREVNEVDDVQLTSSDITGLVLKDIEPNAKIIFMSHLNKLSSTIILNFAAGTSNQDALVVSYLLEPCDPTCASCEIANEPSKCLSCFNDRPFSPPDFCECHKSCTTCTENFNKNKCLICENKKDLGSNKPNTCDFHCHENCYDCVGDRDQFKCTECKPGRIFKETTGSTENNRYGQCLLPEEIDTLAESSTVADCNGARIIGCVECSKKYGLKCKLCVDGTGLDVYTEDYLAGTRCVKCHVLRCKKCEIVMLSKEGRRCQECFEGFKLVNFQDGTQECQLSKDFKIGILFAFFLIFSIFL